jgi:hypothetical protein
MCCDVLWGFFPFEWHSHHGFDLYCSFYFWLVCFLIGFCRVCGLALQLFYLVTFWSTFWFLSSCQFLWPVAWHQGFGCPIFVCFIFFQNALNKDFHHTCRGAFKIKGHLNCFWDPLSMFCPKTLLFTSLFPSFNIFLTLLHLFWLDLHVSFLETLGPKFFGLHVCLFAMLTSFSPHFSWELASFP